MWFLRASLSSVPYRPRTATAKTNCRKRRVKLAMTSGRGWLLETVEDGFLLKREKAMAREGEVSICSFRGYNKEKRKKG